VDQFTGVIVSDIVATLLVAWPSLALYEKLRGVVIVRRRIGEPPLAFKSACVGWADVEHRGQRGVSTSVHARTQRGRHKRRVFAVV